MSTATKKLEQKWAGNFLRSSLINKETGKLNQSLAHQLFYGPSSESQDERFPAGYQELYNRRNKSTDEVKSQVQQILFYLSLTGIELNPDSFLNHLETESSELEKLYVNTFYFLRTLAHHGDRFDPYKPFKDVGRNIYFLLRLETGELKSNPQLELFDEVPLPELYNRFSDLPEGYSENEIVKELFQRIEFSNESFFITGKAGTGKSTFVQYFSNYSGKKVLKLAYTGIAAINVGGQTVHSFFLFPLKPMLPQDDEIPKFKPGSERLLVLQETDCILLDEVSMLRSDLLEAIDFSLRINGGDPELPFGGKQMLFVGDLFQLPPIVNLKDETERILFREEYRSEYFFDAPAYRELAPTLFEFRKSYRQKEDLEFVELLDAVRICENDSDLLKQLNERFDPDYVPDRNEYVMNLCTNNWLADNKNRLHLDELPFTPFHFEAKISGEFPEDRYPTSPILELKKNAQVILIKNDKTLRWVNGTLAKVDFISNDILEVRLQDGKIFRLEPNTWENRRFKFDRIRRKVVSELVGTFTQYPVKLAWAITIHKSQGLTFEKVNLDLGSGAFVNGQVYTALSRCKSLSGLVLKKPLRAQDIILDQRILGFWQAEQIEQILVEGE